MKKTMLLFLLILVISSPAFAAFVNNGDGTVTDTATGLMWELKTNGEEDRDKVIPFSWRGALAYCKGLILGGYTDWRLPNIKELASIVDLTRYNPSIDPVFETYTVLSSYWSSSTVASDVGKARGVTFSGGYDDRSYKTSYRYVRAVRGRQSGASSLKGDISGDNALDLSDAILSLKIIAGMTLEQDVSLTSEVNDDSKIGLEEAVYILQTVAGLKN